LNGLPDIHGSCGGITSVRVRVLKKEKSEEPGRPHRCVAQDDRPAVGTEPRRHLAPLAQEQGQARGGERTEGDEQGEGKGDAEVGQEP
jgi:hypothetical protein